MGLRLTILCLAMLTVACQSRTELIVITDTDFSIPDEVDSFRIEVTDPSGRMMTADAPLGAGEAPPPRFLGVVPDRGSLGPFEIRATGRMGGLPVVTRDAQVTLELDRTLALELFLGRDCLNVVCDGTSTCAGGNCRTAVIATDELRDWNGAPMPRDAGEPPDDDAGPPVETDGGLDAGPRIETDGCVASAEVCNGADDDCDTMIDEDVDTTSDPMNCGACGTVCSAPNATVGCQASDCVITGCDAGFDDCDGMYSTGCEADLTLPATCGSCTTSCSPPDRDCCDGACGRC